jgi:predicted DNA-binding protein (UPF0251 family)
MSPRPRKHRRCSCPFREGEVAIFKPAGTPLAKLDRIILPHDEMESVLLCDLEGLTQEETGKRMGVSRGTVQRLVTSGRSRIAAALAQGKALVIEPS